MNVSRLMTYGVYALGVLMVILGLFFVSAGVPIVRMEIGWAEIISGSVAASAGCIVVVLGLLLSNLETMQSAIDRLASAESGAPYEDTLPFRPTISEPFEVEAPVAPAPPPEVRPIHPLAPAARRDAAPMTVAEVQPEPLLTAALHPEEEEIAPPPTAPAAEPAPHQPALDEGAPALVHAQDEETAQSPPVAAPDPVADPIAESPPARLRSKFLASMLARRPSLATERPRAPAPAAPVIVPLQTAEAAPRTIVDLSSGWDDEPASPTTPLAEPDQPAMEPTAPADYHAETASPQHDEILDLAAPAAPPPVGHVAEEAVATPPEPPPVPDPLTPVVVGRYNAGTASYVMYSNGMIEVETEHGTHQFASMQDLKAFIERRDARAS